MRAAREPKCDKVTKEKKGVVSEFGLFSLGKTVPENRKTYKACSSGVPPTN